MKLNITFSKTFFFLKLDPSIRNDESFGNSKTISSKLLDPPTPPRSFFNCYNHKEIRLGARLRLGLSHLREHKLNHSFQNWINLLCSCGMDFKSTSHFFLLSPLFDDKRITLLSTLSKIDCKVLETNEPSFNRNTVVWQFIVWLERKLSYP